MFRTDRSVRALLLLALMLPYTVVGCDKSRQEAVREADGATSAASQPSPLPTGVKVIGKDVEGHAQEIRKRLKETRIEIYYDHTAPVWGVIMMISQEAGVSYHTRRIPEEQHVRLYRGTYDAVMLLEIMLAQGVRYRIDDTGLSYTYDPAVSDEDGLRVRIERETETVPYDAYHNKYESSDIE